MCQSSNEKYRKALLETQTTSLNTIEVVAEAVVRGEDSLSHF